MSWFVTAGGVLLFVLSLLVHVVVWRTVHPRNDVRALVLVFIAGPAAAIGLLLFLLPAQSWHGIGTGPEMLAVMLLHLALSGAYIASYPAVQAISPSLDLLLIVSRVPGRRMAEETIVSTYRGTGLVRDRVRDLHLSNLIEEHGGEFVLRPRARCIALLFIVYRRLLGLPMGEG